MTWKALSLEINDIDGVAKGESGRRYFEPITYICSYIFLLFEIDLIKLLFVFILYRFIDVFAEGDLIDNMRVMQIWH